MAYSRNVTVIRTIIIVGVIYTYWQYVQYVIYAVSMFMAVKLACKVIASIRKCLHSYALKDVDTMDGLAFECYIANVFKNHGYTNIKLTEKYDYGVDIIADKDGERWGIQVKRYSGLVKADAVRQVVTGLNMYNCDRAMVVTNSVFSRVAVKLAKSNGCVLVDRSGLAKMGISLTR